MSTEFLWELPPSAEVLAGIEHLRANHPTSVMLSIPLKLRTSRFKERMLYVTEQRITSMKSDIFTRFRQDLELIVSGTTRERFINALVVMCRMSPLAFSAKRIQQLQDYCESLPVQDDPLALPIAIVQTMAHPDMTQHHALEVLRTTLEHGQSKKPDARLIKTLENATEATKSSANAKDTTKASALRQNNNGAIDQSSTKEKEPRYTPEQLAHIKYAILLRKALQQQHILYMRMLRLTTLAEFAQRHDHDQTKAQQITQEIAKSSNDHINQCLIDYLCDCVGHDEAFHAINDADIAGLREVLLALHQERGAKQRKSRSTKKQQESLDSVKPFVCAIIQTLAVDQHESPELEPMVKLRRILDDWFAGRSQQDQQGLTDRMNGSGAQKTGSNAQQRRYAVLLNAYLQHPLTLQTDVLVSIELAEATIRLFGDGAQLLYTLISRCYGEACSKYKSPSSGVIRQGNFVECSKAILGWAQQVIDYQIKYDTIVAGHAPSSQRSHRSESPLYQKRVISLPMIYATWQEQLSRYRESAATVVPIGPDVGKTLGNPDALLQTPRKRISVIGKRSVGKRGARRIKRWLLPAHVVATTLEYLQVLDYPHLFSEKQVDSAKAAPHPYWIAKKQQKRTVRAMRPSQFHEQPSPKAMRLGQLSQQQRHLLQLQLRELQAYAPHFDALKLHIDLFLASAPPDFPFVAPVMYTKQEIQHLPFDLQAEIALSLDDLQDRYEQYLDGYRDFRPRRGQPFAGYAPEKLYDTETVRAQNLEQIAAKLRQGKLQPITFHRTTDSEQKHKSFTLLVYEHTHARQTRKRYVFACELMGEDAPERAEIIEGFLAEQAERPSRTFVNYPGHVFDDRKEASLLYFAVEMGDTYQGQLLQQVIEQQMQAPIKCKKDCLYLETGQHLPSCAPEAVITTATLLKTVNAFGNVEWFVQLTMPIAAVRCSNAIDSVVGLHEDEGHVYFAVVDLQGKLLDIGEIGVPAWVGPQSPKGQSSKNFAYELVWSMFRQSTTEHYTASLAIENTDWKRTIVTTSPAKNRTLFSFPRAQIQSIARTKSAQAGYLRPLIVYGVAPTRDCSHCGKRLENTSGVHKQRIYHCPHCELLGHEHTLTECTEGYDSFVQCSACERLWTPREYIFTCPACNTSLFAPYNTALVVARRMLKLLSSIQPNQKKKEGGESNNTSP